MTKSVKQDTDIHQLLAHLYHLVNQSKTPVSEVLSYAIATAYNVELLSKDSESIQQQKNAKRLFKLTNHLRHTRLDDIGSKQIFRNYHIMQSFLLGTIYHYLKHGLSSNDYCLITTPKLFDFKLK